MNFFFAKFDTKNEKSEIHLSFARNVDDCWLKFWDLSGAKVCRSCQELSNEYVLAKIGFDTAESEPFKVPCRFRLHANYLKCKVSIIRKHLRTCITYQTIEFTRNWPAKIRTPGGSGTSQPRPPGARSAWACRASSSGTPGRRPRPWRCSPSAAWRTHPRYVPRRYKMILRKTKYVYDNMRKTHNVVFPF